MTLNSPVNLGKIKRFEYVNLKYPALVAIRKKKKALPKESLKFVIE